MNDPNEDLAGNRFVESTTTDNTEVPTLPEPPPLTPEFVAERFKTLKSTRPGLHIIMPNGFSQGMQGSYPVYQQPLVAPFIANDGRKMQAATIITMAKAEWEHKNMAVYVERRLEAYNKLLDWVEAGVVPVRADGCEDQIKVSEWGEGTDHPEAEPKSGIVLTDL